MSEIQRLHSSLFEQGVQNLFSLHGSMTLNEQHKTLSPSSNSKIILSTNIAETSLTIDGVDCVIDTGLKRELDLDPKKLFANLKMSKISKASAEQRRGRAGRQFQGRCLRLWSKLDENAMAAFDKAEILSSDLTDYLLSIYALGISNYKSFSWFESPPDLHLSLADEFLREIGAVDNYGITKLGKKISSYPLGARLARVLLDFEEAQMSEIGSLVCALLNEKDPMNSQDLESWASLQWDSDLAPRIYQYYELKNKNRLGSEWTTIDKMHVKTNKVINPDKINYDHIHRILLKSFPDRLCRRRRKLEKSGLSSKGTGVELNPKSLVRQTEFFVALNGRNLNNQANSIVDIAIPIQKSWITEDFSSFIESKEELQFNESKKSYLKLKKSYFRNLALSDGVPTTLTLDELSLLLEQTILSTWTELLEKNETLQQLIRRLEVARQFYPDKNFPEFNDELKKTVVSQACYGENSLNSILEKDFEVFLELSFNADQKMTFKREVPSKIINPTGKHLNLNYDNQCGVSLELKIQDAFGWKVSPSVCSGKNKIRLILLGPNKRPLQMTQDLESFWKGAYLDLRPALKAKYHRHSWPEDPTAL
jgi:ATP-dependent helicase HrpB